MLGILNKAQIESFLTGQVTGRLGCNFEDKTYIVPVNYVYRNNTIYAHSGPGEKVRMMRGNPKVCFQVDQIQDTFNWISVIVWGTFEEITDESKKQQAMQGIIHKLMPLTNLPDEHPSHGIASSEANIDINIPTIVYCIRIVEQSGRFESHSDF